VALSLVVLDTGQVWGVGGRWDPLYTPDLMLGICHVYQGSVSWLVLVGGDN